MVQIQVLPVSDKYNAYAREVVSGLMDAGLRAEANLKSDRIGYKIRSAAMQKTPYVIVVGEKEAAANTINVRSRDDGEIGEMSLDAFLESIADARNAPTLQKKSAEQAA